ncbi:hypothetical protein ACHAW5_000458 [Stephanodiscus triporus]|uniref:Uncharacterized protein n=1 Tax=Stephanodiscus triporus TaxID=2934178 RepID=A0ABD3NRH7_9STRA
MVGYLRCFCSLYAAVLVACIPQIVTAKQDKQPALRRVDVMVDNSDEYADTVVSLQAPKKAVGLGYHDHAKIKSILSTSKEMISTAKALIEDVRTLKEGTKMMEDANALFKEVKAHIAKRKLASEAGSIRRKYSAHDIQQAEEDEERALDVARSVFEVAITFPECVEMFLQDCLSTINSQVQSLGLATIETVVHEKRNLSQPGYNKVVIITDLSAQRVLGQAGDGIVTYPFLWDDAVSGLKSLGVDGKWNCVDLTPEDCCRDIKESAPTIDTRGNYVECNIYVPWGGKNKPKRNDRVFINLSPDGRVHEAPIIE